MAITKIAGELLESNLIRTTDLAFNTNLLVVDVANGRIGIGTDTPGNFKLDVVGDTRITGSQTITGDLIVQGNTTTIDSQNLSIEDNMIVLNSSGSIGNDSGLMINRGAAGNNAVFFWDEDADVFKFGTTSTGDGSTQTDFGGATLVTVEAGNFKVNPAVTPPSDGSMAHKKYVDDEVGTVSSSVPTSGGSLNLGLPTDSSFGDGAFTLTGWDLETCQRFKLPILGVIGNNSAMNQIRCGQISKYGAERGNVGNLFGDVDFEKFAEMLGGHGEVVREPDQIKPALDRARDAVKSGTSALVNIWVDREEWAPGTRNQTMYK